MKRCGQAYSVAITYVPALCDMAEALIKSRVLGRKSYSLEGSPEVGWTIRGSDGYGEFMGVGLDSRDRCVRILERLNGVV